VLIIQIAEYLFVSTLTLFVLLKVLSEKMRNIVGRFRSRAKKVRRRLEAPPSPEDADLLSDDGNDQPEVNQPE
jgi:hypothetical protein